MSKYAGKYRNESPRMPSWDYAGKGLYFITFITEGRDEWFGEIDENNEIILSEFGIIANDEWNKSFEIRKELKLHEYILMPNHIHAIVELTAPYLRLNKPFEFKRKPKSISSFIAGYKSATTSHIDDYIDEHHLNMPKFNRDNKLWQRNYHDNVIRNKEEYYRIKQYIKNNPCVWRENL